MAIEIDALSIKNGGFFHSWWCFLYVYQRVRRVSGDVFYHVYLCHPQFPYVSLRKTMTLHCQIDGEIADLGRGTAELGTGWLRSPGCVMFLGIWWTSINMMNMAMVKSIYVHCQIKSFVASQILLWSSLNHFDLSLWALEGALWASNLMAHWGPLEHRTPKGRVLSWGFACLVWKWFKVSNLGKQCLDRLSTATKDIKRL